MNSIWIKPPRFIRFFFPDFVWKVKTREKKVYLTFDDGPTASITDWTLALLKKYDAKATFFCIGQNIDSHPDILRNVIGAGHTIGNHTNDHPEGWSTDNPIYYRSVDDCALALERQKNSSDLFRPPYGKIKTSQSRYLRKRGYKIIMWDVLSQDYDTSVSREKCLDNVLKNIVPGSIIVFHDSVKAFPNLEYALPGTLDYLKENGFVCEALKAAPAQGL